MKIIRFICSIREPFKKRMFPAVKYAAKCADENKSTMIVLNVFVALEAKTFAMEQSLILFYGEIGINMKIVNGSAVVMDPYAFT